MTNFGLSGRRWSANSKTAGTSLAMSIVVAGSGNPVVGDVILFAIAYDNLTSTTPTASIMLSNGVGSIGSVNYNHPNGTSSSAASWAKLTYGWCRVTADFDASTTITVSLSGSVTAKAGVAACLGNANDPAFIPFTEAGGVTSFDMTSAINGANIPVWQDGAGAYAFTFYAHEGATATGILTWTTVTGNYSGFETAATSGGGAASNVYAGLGYMYHNTPGDLWSSFVFQPTDGSMGMFLLTQVASTTPVTASRSTTWNVLQQVTANRNTTWNVQGLASVTASRSTTWNTLKTVTQARTTTWNTRQTVTQARTTTWNTRQAVTSARSTTWNALQQVTANRNTTWNVAATGGGVTAPTLVNTFTAVQPRNNVALTFSVTNVQVGDILVFKGFTENEGLLSLPVTTGQTWTNRATVNAASYCSGRIDTLVSTASGTLSVSVSNSATQPSHSGVVEQWRSAALATTPATNTQTNQSGVAPSSTITTVSDNSVVSWMNADYNAVAYTTRTYRSSATEELVHGTTGVDYSAYYARQATTTAGSQTYGLTAPVGQKPAMIAIEIQGVASGSLVSVTSTRTTTWVTQPNVSPPYSNAMKWNTPLATLYPSGVPLRTDSSTLMGRVLDGHGTTPTRNYLGSDTSQSTLPVYYVDNNTPLVNVRVWGSWRNGSDDNVQGTYQVNQDIQVPMPPIPKVVGFSDYQIIIINVDTGDEWNFWKVGTVSDESSQPGLDGNSVWQSYDIGSGVMRYTCQSAARYGPVGANSVTTTGGYFTGNGKPSMTPQAWGMRGAKVPYGIGLVRKTEVQSGVINHAIAWAYHGPSPDFVDPAQGSDGGAFGGVSGSDIPEGARIRLRPDFDINSFPAGTARIVGQALKDYGAILIDNSGWPKVYLEADPTGQWSDVTASMLSAATLADYQVVEWVETTPPPSGNFEPVGIAQTGNMTTSVASVNVTLATGVNTGDIDFVGITVQAASVGITTPTGWTLVKNQTESSGVYTSVFSRVRQAGDPASVTFTITGATTLGGWIAWAYTGQDATTPVGTAVGGADAVSDTTLNVPALTTTGTNSYRVVVSGLGSGSTVFNTAPTGLTILGQNSGGKVIAVAHAASTSAQTYAASSWVTSAAARGTAIHFEIYGGVALASVTSTRSTTWNTKAAVTSARTTTWHTLKSITNSKTTTWNTRQAVTSTRTTTWNALQQVTANRNTTWNVAQLVSVTASRSTTWNVLKQVTSARSTTWNVIQTITSSRTTTWHTRASVTGARSSLWNVLAAVTSTRGTTWNALQSVTATRTSTWNALLQVQSSRTTTWNVAGNLISVTSARTTTWNTFAFSTGSRTTTWNVLRTLATPATRTTTWNVLQSTVSTRNTSWNVLQSTTAVRTTTWNTFTRVTGVRTTTWNALQTVTANRLTTWNVSDVGSVTASRATTWNTLAPVAGTRTTTWRVLQSTVSTRNTSWNTRALVTEVRTTTWNVAQAVTSARTTTWNTRFAVTQSRTTTWNVRGQVTGLRTTTWNTRKQITAARTTTWNTLIYLVLSRTTTWNTRAAVTATRVTMWNVTSLGLSWDLYRPGGWIQASVMCQNSLGVWVPAQEQVQWNGTDWVPIFAPVP